MIFARYRGEFAGSAARARLDDLHGLSTARALAQPADFIRASFAKINFVGGSGAKNGVRRFLAAFATFALVVPAAAAQTDASKLESIDELIAAKNYSALCHPWVLDIARTNMDEAILSAYGDACARVDLINRLSVPIALLRNSPAGRANAVIFATLIYKKKLLQAALIDGMDISMIALPRLDYELSEVYDAFVAKQFAPSASRPGALEFAAPNKRYLLWVERDSQPAKLMLQVISADTSTIKEFY